MLTSTFDLLQHARKVTPLYEQRAKYLADTIAQLRVYQPPKHKKSLVSALLVRYTELLETCNQKIEKHNL